MVFCLGLKYFDKCIWYIWINPSFCIISALVHKVTLTIANNYHAILRTGFSWATSFLHFCFECLASSWLKLVSQDLHPQFYTCITWQKFLWWSIHPSSHNFPLYWKFCYSVNRLSRIFRIFRYISRYSPNKYFPVPPGGSWDFPRLDEIHNLSNGFWVWPRISSQFGMPRKPPWVGIQERCLPDALTTSAATPFEMALRFLWMSEFVTLCVCWAQPPFRKNSFRRLVFRALISGSQGSNADGSVPFFTTTVWNHSFITTDASPVWQLNSRSTFSLLVHKIPRYYDSFS